MGPARSRAIIDKDHAACLCRDAVAVMPDQSSALNSGSSAAAAEANKRLERDPTEQAILATIRELRSKSPEPPAPVRLLMAACVGPPGHPLRVFFSSCQENPTQICRLSDVTERPRHTRVELACDFNLR